MATRTTSVFARAQFTGFHRWPDAGNGRFYLRDLHRHIFNVQVEIGVDHPDRAIEFHDVVDFVGYTVHRIGLNNPFGPNDHLQTLSCEGIAELILDEVIKQWPDRPTYSVIVDEDNENGAQVSQHG